MTICAHCHKPIKEKTFHICPLKGQIYWVHVDSDAMYCTTRVAEPAPTDPAHDSLVKALKNCMEAINLLPGHSQMRRVVDDARTALREAGEQI